MSTTLYAMFDGEVLRPDQPLPFAPNTRVRLTVEEDEVEEEEPAGQRPASFLRTARSLNVDGPPDWSTRLDDYLYGGESGSDD